MNWRMRCRTKFGITAPIPSLQGLPKQSFCIVYQRLLQSHKKTERRSIPLLAKACEVGKGGVRGGLSRKAFPLLASRIGSSNLTMTVRSVIHYPSSRPDSYRDSGSRTALHMNWRMRCRTKFSIDCALSASHLGIAVYFSPSLAVLFLGQFQ